MPKTEETTENRPERAPRASKSSKKETLDRGDVFAVIETGGKQYRVSVGDSIKIEKMANVNEGSQVVFDKVLLIDNGVDSTDIGTPYLEKAKVSGIVTEIGRNPKITVIKYKQKSRYFKKNGHRQPFIKVRIDRIE